MAHARQQTTAANYVFKMHYDGGGASAMNRRYGYQGELALPQVYEVSDSPVSLTHSAPSPDDREPYTQGLIDRSSQAFGIPRGDVVIFVRDNLGNLTKTLDSYQTFLRHVFLPIQQRPSEVKIDEKQRVVLAFAVFNKKDLDKRAERKRKEKEAQAARQAVEAAALKKRLIIEKQAALAKAQAEVRAKHASARDPPKKVSVPGSCTNGSHADNVPPRSSRRRARRLRCPSARRSRRRRRQRSHSRTRPSRLSRPLPPRRLTPPLPPRPRKLLLQSRVSLARCARSRLSRKPSTKPTRGRASRTSSRRLCRTSTCTLPTLSATLPFRSISRSFRTRRRLASCKNRSRKSKPSRQNLCSLLPPLLSSTRAFSAMVAGQSHGVCRNRDVGARCSPFDCSCSADMTGLRYKCRDCSNYDLCGPCIDERDKHHPTNHKFVSIARPGAPSHASERGTKLQLPVLSPSVTPVVPAPAAAPVRHAATCNLCDKGIIGVRYKCLECPDFDVDAECFSTHVEQLHPHPFVRLHAREDYVRATQVDLRGRHERIVCDGCQRSPIVGTRYKCMHSACPDYDLCADCEALPIPVHPRNHPLLKIRWPLERSGLDGAQAIRERGQAVIGSALPGPTSRPAQASSSLADVLEAFGTPRVVGSNTAISYVQILDGPGDHKTIVADIDLAQVHSAPPETIQVCESEAGVSVEQAGAPVIVGESREQAPSAATEEEETKSLEAPEPDAMDTETEQTTRDASVKSMEASECAAALDTTQSLKPEEGVTSAETEEQAASQQSALPRAAFVSDITLLDGIAVPAGAEFQKVWAVRAGPTGWPTGCRLVHVGGFSSRHFSTNSDRPSSFEVAAAEPNEIVSISCEAKAPEDSGRFMDFWRLSLPDGTLFGERLWIDLTIETEDMAASSAHLSGSSLATSFMAPSLDAHGKSSSVPASIAHTARSSPSAPSSTVFSVPSSRDGDMSDFESVGAMTRSNTGTSERREVSSSAAAHEDDSMDEDTPDEDGFVYLSGQDDDF